MRNDKVGYWIPGVGKVKSQSVMKEEKKDSLVKQQIDAR